MFVNKFKINLSTLASGATATTATGNGLANFLSTPIVGTVAALASSGAVGLVNLILE